MQGATTFENAGHFKSFSFKTHITNKSSHIIEQCWTIKSIFQLIILESVKANLRKNSTDSIEVYLNFSLSWEHLNFNELLEWEKIYKRPSQEKSLQ